MQNELKDIMIIIILGSYGIILGYIFENFSKLRKKEKLNYQRITIFILLMPFYLMLTFIIMRELLT